MRAGIVDGPGAGVAASSCGDWRTWIKVNETRLRSGGHSAARVDAYVEAPFVDADFDCHDQVDDRDYLFRPGGA